MATSPITTNSLSSSSSSLFSASLPSLLPRRRVPLPLALRRRHGTPAIRAKIREIFMPALSSTMTEGKIVSWVKAEGDRLSKGESVVVVESDKADMDVETFYDGILAAIVVPEGQSAPVGAPIGLLAESEDEVPLAKAQALSQSQPQTPPSPPPPAEATPPPPPPATAPPTPVAAAAAPVQEGPRKTIATPFAKKLAKQHKVDLAKVAGTGPYGRITSTDIEAAAGIQPKKPAAAPAAPAPATSITAAAATATAKGSAAAAPPPLPGSTVVPFTTMQAAVSKNMLESLSVPTFRVGYPVMTDALDALYEKVWHLPLAVGKFGA